MEDMDAILDQALDDLENIDTFVSSKEEPESQATTQVKSDCSQNDITIPQQQQQQQQQGKNDAQESNHHDKEKEPTVLDPKDFLKFLIEGGGVGDDNDDDDLGEEDRDAKLDEFMKNIQKKFPQEQEAESSSSSSTFGAKKGNEDEDDVAATLASILEQMTTMDKEDDDDPRCFPPKGDFDVGSFNPDDIVDGMMEQLLSKDLMYEPMKQVADRFPAWLEANKDHLSVEDLERYVKIYPFFALKPSSSYPFIDF